MKKETLCWSCDNRNCSWHQRLEPVKGWDAHKDYVAADETETYCVDRCPEYHLWDRYFIWLLTAPTNHITQGKPILDEAIMEKISPISAALIKMRMEETPVQTMADYFGNSSGRMNRLLSKAGRQYIEARDKEEVR